MGNVIRHARHILICLVRYHVRHNTVSDIESVYVGADGDHRACAVRSGHYVRGSIELDPAGNLALRNNQPSLYFGNQLRNQV